MLRRRSLLDASMLCMPLEFFAVVLRASLRLVCR